MEDDPPRATLYETEHNASLKFQTELAMEIISLKFRIALCLAGKQRFRRIPPSNYTVKIESFSLLLDAKMEKYETKYFEAGGYKWRMVLYPNGKNNEEGDRHISLFLSIAEAHNISLGFEVNVNVNFFLFDGIRDRYLVVQDADDNEWRYHKMKTEWGFTKLISHDALNNPNNGYLVDDVCIFGVEVFVVKSSLVGESLSLVKEPRNGLYTWNISNYSALDKHIHYSEVFTVEGRKWKLKLFPKGVSYAAGAHSKHLSLFLMLDDSETLESGLKLYAKFVLRIKNQTSCKHREFRAGLWFDDSGNDWGLKEYMLLSTLKDPSNGYLLNDCVMIEAEFDFVSTAKDFS